MENLFGAFKAIHGSTVSFFKDKGFRRYNPALGTWMVLTTDEMIIEVNQVIRDTPFLSCLSSVNNPRFWLPFLDWFEVAGRNRKVNSTRPLIGFRNLTLDTSNMKVLDHNPENYCFQAIDTEFRSGPPTEFSFFSGWVRTIQER